MRQYANNRQRREGFTLIELLVVIAIIVILAAILFPVFGSVREKAKQTNCMSNLHQISIALKSYREDTGRYPFQPYNDHNLHRYIGGVSSLYPDYIPQRAILICPDDIQIKGRTQEAKDRVYSSYNGWVAAPGATDDTWDFDTATGTKSPDGNATVSPAGPKRTYNWFGYSNDGWDPFYWNDATHTNMPYASSLPSWLRSAGLSYRHYPRLANRQAPDNTIITRCIHHEAFYKKATEKMDAIVTVGGNTKMVNIGNMSQLGDDLAHPCKWVKQSD